MTEDKLINGPSTIYRTDITVDRSNMGPTRVSFVRSGSWWPRIRTRSGGSVVYECFVSPGAIFSRSWLDLPIRVAAGQHLFISSEGGVEFTCRTYFEPGETI